MKKILFAGIVCGFALCASAQIAPAKIAAKIAPATEEATANTRPIKHLPASPAGIIKPRKVAVLHSEQAQLPEGFVLFESFEGWDGTTPDWTPDGWTVEMKGEVERPQSWTPSAMSPYLPAPTDGQYYYGISFADDQQDEWLISPTVEIKENMVLSFDAYIDPVYLFSLENVDWDTGMFIGDKEVAATLQIWAQAEGEEWMMLHDYADDYMDMTLEELYMQTPTNLIRKTVSLAPVAGKNARIAFRYVGLDGNTMFLDAVAISMPVLEGVCYMEPFSALYWGFDRSANLSSTAVGIAQYPVFAPLTWTNISDCDEADFTWVYDDPDMPGAFMTDNDPYELTVAYKPDYSSAATKKNNFKNPPTLNASAPGAAPAAFSAPYLYFQAGGKAEITFNDGSEFDGSLLPFCYQDLGLTFITCEDSEAGMGSIPVFGYDENKFVDSYWLKYSLNGQAPTETDYSRLTAFGNLFMPSDAPLVVNGLTLYAFGQIEPEAELTATIYGLNAEMRNDFSTFTKIASAVCKGSDIIASIPDAKYYIVLPFDFDEPVVLKATEEHPAYMIFIENFRGEGVKYFAPLQSSKPDVVNWGYIMNDIDLEAHTGRPPYTNIKPMVYKPDIDGDTYADPMAAFAIGMNAEYPWLTCDTESVDFVGETSVLLGSYYDGNKLTVETPEGIQATVSGRYDECVLTLQADEATEGTVTVSGPGVEVSIAVKAEKAGIHEVEAGDSLNGTDDIYDLQGRRVMNPRSGIFLRANGTKFIRL